MDSFMFDWRISLIKIKSKWNFEEDELGGGFEGKELSGKKRKREIGKKMGCQFLKWVLW